MMGKTLYVAGSTQTRKLRAFQLQWTTDMPGGDKLGCATGHNGFKPNRFRDFHGVFHKTHMHFPPRDPKLEKPSSAAIERLDEPLPAWAQVR